MRMIVWPRDSPSCRSRLPFTSFLSTSSCRFPSSFHTLRTVVSETRRETDEVNGRRKEGCERNGNGKRRRKRYEPYGTLIVMLSLRFLVRISTPFISLRSTVSFPPRSGSERSERGRRPYRRLRPKRMLTGRRYERRTTCLRTFFRFIVTSSYIILLSCSCFPFLSALHSRSSLNGKGKGMEERIDMEGT